MIEESKVWIGGLPWAAREDEVKQEILRVAGRHIRVASVKVILDHQTGRSKGYAFVGLATPSDADEVMHKMNESMMAGRRIIVKPATQRMSEDFSSQPAAYHQHLEPHYRSRSRSRSPPSQPRYSDRHESPKRRQRSPEPPSRGRGPPPPRQRSPAPRPWSPPPRARSPGRGDTSLRPAYRVAVSGLPAFYTWRELKDFLRAGNLRISYAAVTRPGIGVGDYDTEEDRDQAIRRLDRKQLETGIVRIKADTHPQYLQRPPEVGPAREVHGQDRFRDSHFGNPAAAARDFGSERDRRRSPERRVERPRSPEDLRGRQTFRKGVEVYED